MTGYHGIGWPGALGAALVSSLALSASAEQTTIKSCYAEYAANKAKIEAKGFTQKDFLADCLLRPAGAPATAAAAEPPHAAGATAAPAVPVPPASPVRSAIDPDAAVLVVIVASSAASPAATAKLGNFAKRDACLASARAIRVNLKKATDIAKIDCVPAATFEAGAGSR